MSSNMVPAAGTMGFPAIFIGVAYTVVTSGTSQQVTFTDNPSIVKFYATQDCFIAHGLNPTASSSTSFHAGGTTDYYGILPGYKLAVIQSSVSGTVRITQGS